MRLFLECILNKFIAMLFLLHTPSLANTTTLPKAWVRYGKRLSRTDLENPCTGRIFQRLEVDFSSIHVSDDISAIQELGHDVKEARRQLQGLLNGYCRRLGFHFRGASPGCTRETEEIRAILHRWTHSRLDFCRNCKCVTDQLDEDSVQTKLLTIYFYLQEMTVKFGLLHRVETSCSRRTESPFDEQLDRFIFTYMRSLLCKLRGLFTGRPAARFSHRINQVHHLLSLNDTCSYLSIQNRDIDLTGLIIISELDCLLSAMDQECTGTELTLRSYSQKKWKGKFKLPHQQKYFFY
ncbi:uncharacterized protein LOC106177388 isoform X2 [Lingula anatina]|uniref:Uncharacterized protein LOC106177388 isoform X1 n=1 Tax=Lingula anatina TaxID=7574 RepID=A0A1S3JZ81_LINAN|nr:uncharacterized protein LOC106177388 isoform X1 [Lingula anatina]XP_013415597.1 uncharacterized protein LOC106177388 isoform X2 [Lingula anatina]|eukprot:XP_013415596.1 uncharacterized protein LOC106177388 isoform X1 [Lingula anatina]